VPLAQLTSPGRVGAVGAPIPHRPDPAQGPIDRGRLSPSGPPAGLRGQPGPIHRSRGPVDERTGKFSISNPLIGETSSPVGPPARLKGKGFAKERSTTRRWRDEGPSVCFSFRSPSGATVPRVCAGDQKSRTLPNRDDDKDEIRTRARFLRPGNIRSGLNGEFSWTWTWRLGRLGYFALWDMMAAPLLPPTWVPYLEFKRMEFQSRVEVDGVRMEVAISTSS
jgi:hypothetical protein